MEIQEIDRIASQIQDFNPAAYTSLVNQFEALAQQATQQNAANPARERKPRDRAGTPTPEHKRERRRIPRG